MPFVKRVNSRITRPSGEMRKIFIGRTTELQFFVEHILKPDDPSYNIISISGEGGVGKSTLLARFIEEARSSDFRDFCLTALVDESQMTPYSVMENFAQQLSEAGAPLIEFERGLTRYKETVKKLHIQKEAAQETAIREAVDFVGTIVEEVPVVGGVLQKTANMATELYLKDHQIRQMLKDSTLLENPIRDLTKVFIEELNQLSDKQILLGHNRIKRQQRFILFFDTFEQLSTEIAPWLIDYFLPSNISTNIVLVIASRDSIEHSMPNDPKRWLPYRNQGILHLINLNSFTEDETRAYLAKQGIIEPQNVTTIWQLSKGLPLYLGLLTFNLESSIDPTADVVANFLRWIPENEIIKHKLVLDIALFSKPFNQDDLIAFTYLPENEIDMLYLWLIRLPFIRNSHQDGRYRYHELAQEMFRRHLYQRSQEEYYATRRALSAYYQRLLNNMLDQVGKRAYMFAEFVEIALASAYQLCYLPDEASHATSIELITNVYRYTNAEMKRESLKFLRDLPSEQQNTKINFTGLSFAKQLLLVLEAHIENKYKNLIEATNELIKNASRKPLFSPPFFRWIYNIRGIAYHDLKEYQRAIEDFTQAINLNPEYTSGYVARSEAFRLIGKYEDALSDLNCISEFDKSINADPFNNKGLILSYLKRYEEAIENYNEGLKKAPNTINLLYNMAVSMMRLHGLSIAKSHINIAYDALLALKDNETQHIKFYGLGGLAALTGETDQALDYLQKAIPLDEDVIGWARHDMAWIDLHSNPCFQALIK